MRASLASEFSRKSGRNLGGRQRSLGEYVGRSRLKPARSRGCLPARIDFLRLLGPVFLGGKELWFTDPKRVVAMNTANDPFSTADEGNIVTDLLCSALLIIWRLVRIPILIVLAFLEPFVRFVLTGIAILSVLTALVFKGFSAPPPIPFWVMMCVSLGCVMLVPAYHFILRLLSR